MCFTGLEPGHAGPHQYELLLGPPVKLLIRNACLLQKLFLPLRQITPRLRQRTTPAFRLVDILIQNLESFFVLSVRQNALQYLLLPLQTDNFVIRIMITRFEYGD